MDVATITAEDARRGIAEAREDFSVAFSAMVREMSEKDLAFALAMLGVSDGSRLVDIAARMDVTNGYASTYKQHLSRKALLVSVPAGAWISISSFYVSILDEFYTE